MPTITALDAIVINRPLGDVFGFVSDTTNDPAWHMDITEAQRRDPGPTRLGTTFDIRIKPFMGQSSGELRVTGFEPDALVELQGHMGSMEPTVRYGFRPTSGGTEVTREVLLQPPGLLRILQPLMRSMFAKRNKEYLGNLKRVLEGGAES